MVLVKAWVDLSLPNIAAPQLVEVASLGHQYVASAQRVPFNLATLNRDALYLS
jgi:hypothetical protein